MLGVWTKAINNLPMCHFWQLTAILKPNCCLTLQQVYLKLQFKHWATEKMSKQVSTLQVICGLWKCMHAHCVLLRSEMNIPKEISSAYSSVMCSAIQVSHGIVTVWWLQDSHDCSLSVNVVHFNCCMTKMVEWGGGAVLKFTVLTGVCHLSECPEQS